jgi:SAM-dependent methyltransferase
MNNPDLAFSETLREGSDIFNWILNRNGFKDAKDWTEFLNKKTSILDAGCGNGRVTALMRMYSNPATTKITGIDLVAADIARTNLLDSENIQFYTKDLLEDLSDIGKFDFIYCQEVLHHTKNPYASFQNLVSCLEDGGEIAIYVYKKKAPTREFVDDYVRNAIQGMSYDDAMTACSQIAELGKVLHDMKVKIKAPAIDVLKIEAGEYDLQRFIYHFFMKCFWNPELPYSANTAINYDWYHPQDCTRHTVEEVTGWFESMGLKINHTFVDFYGITMKGKK